MSKLNEFRDMVDSIQDKEVLESGRDLIRDMMEISKLQSQIENLKNGLTDGGRAMFYFFAMDLTDEELVYGAERIVGRIRRIDRADSSKENVDKSNDNK
tara:strand:- start:9003 stop:9299 length:297 start_codon:yes stop_codon:yes gene_type:complete